MIYEEMREKLRNSKCHPYLSLQSSCATLEKAVNIVTDKPLNCVIEIGTYQGLSTAILARLSDRVFTFDICHRNCEYVWDILGIRDRIQMFVSTREFIEYEINFYFRTDWVKQNTVVPFNFAFIDGDHTYEGIKADFELVKFTKRVLFHDYAIAPEVQAFCKEIGAKQVEDLNFAYWENREAT